MFGKKAYENRVGVLESRVSVDNLNVSEKVLLYKILAEVHEKRAEYCYGNWKFCLTCVSGTVIFQICVAITIVLIT